MVKKSNVTCIICNQSKADYLMAKHRNDNLAHNFGYCLDCIREIADDSDQGIIHALRYLNVPYINDIWERALADQPLNPVSKYFQLIAPKKVYKNFLDSEYGKKVSSETNFRITEDVIRRWGKGKEWNDEKYAEYEAALDDLKRIKQPNTTLEEKRYIENVRLGKRLEDEIYNGKATDIKALKATYTQDLKELGLDIETMSKEDSRTLGTRIRDWEKNAPLPEMSKEFSDVDKVALYINKYFTIPMKRVFNQATEEEINSLHDIDKNVDPES
ncbi:hypothetical protein [Enterococcus sp. N249-2]